MNAQHVPSSAEWPKGPDMTHDDKLLSGRAQTDLQQGSWPDFPSPLLESWPGPLPPLGWRCTSPGLPPTHPPAPRPTAVMTHVDRCVTG